MTISPNDHRKATGNRSSSRLPSIPGSRPPDKTQVSRDHVLHMRSTPPAPNQLPIDGGTANWLDQKTAASLRVQAKYTEEGNTSAQKNRTKLPPVLNDGAAQWKAERFIKTQRASQRMYANHAISELRAELADNYVATFPDDAIERRHLAAARVVSELKERVSPERVTGGYDQEMNVDRNRQALLEIRDQEKFNGSKKKKKKDKK